MLKHPKNRDMEKDNQRINYLFVSFIAGLTILFGSSLFYEIKDEFRSADEYALIEGKASFNKDLLYRRWASMHGGVYVPMTDATPPNPALSHIPDRDITTVKGLKLTLVNPAYMTRQVHEIAGGQYGVKGHITSLNPIRPENRPDEWEARALHLFESGESEYSSVENIDGMKHLRFMHAMTVEQNCLKCHGAQGYKVGDIRGGISVSVPMDRYDKIAALHIKKQIATYSFVYAVVLILAGLGFKRLKKEMILRHVQQTKTIESERLLSRSQEIAHIGSWSLDLTTENLYWSDEVYRIFGCKPQEFAATYQAFLEFTHPEDRAAVDEAYSRSVSEGSDNYEIEHRILRQGTGEIRHVHERCVHVRDDTGAIIQSIGMVQDITERKRAEEKMAEQLHELQRWHNVMLDREGRVIELKREVNDLLAKAGESPRYANAREEGSVK